MYLNFIIYLLKYPYFLYKKNIINKHNFITYFNHYKFNI